MEQVYRSVVVLFKRRWTSSAVSAEELDASINTEASGAWALVSVNLKTFFGYPQSALCIQKRQTITF